MVPPICTIYSRSILGFVRRVTSMNPFGALFSGWFITPILGIFMTVKRPMDAVRVNMLTPQEEEFALAGMSKMSPYWAFSFPRRLATYNRFIFPQNFTDRERTVWKRCLVLFLRKLTFWSRKRPLLKSPYHTGRVALLREIFPRAKFVHIYRHPYDVYRSNQHLVQEGLIAFHLQDPHANESFDTSFLENYRALLRTFYDDAQHLPSSDVAEVKFEDLERDPIREIRRVYKELGLQFGDPLRRQMQRYLKSVAGYQKNRFAFVSAAERQLIHTHLEDFMRRWGYEVHMSDEDRAPQAA